MKKPKPKADDLSIPDFLRRKPNEKKKIDASEKVADVKPFKEPWQSALEALRPPAFREFMQHEVARGRFNINWFTVSDRRTQADNDAVMKIFRSKYEEKEIKKKEQGERLKAFREKAPKKVNPLAGMVKLRDFLAGLGEKALSRGHAKVAIDASNIIHSEYHFAPDKMTRAKVEMILKTYVPPAKPTAFDATAVIIWSGKKNPKKEGSDAHGRWALLIACGGGTVGSFLEKEGNPTTLKNAIANGFVTLGIVSDKSENRPSVAKAEKQETKKKPAKKTKPKSKKRKK